MGKFKKGKKKQGKIVSVQEPPNYNKFPVVFSLEKVQLGKYCHSSLDQENKACFAEAIFKRKNLTWDDVIQLDRHGLGTEKIPDSKVRCEKPKFLTEDFKEYLVFRYNNLAPMVGYRLKNVFYVLWFDHDFTLYPH